MHQQIPPVKRLFSMLPHYRAISGLIASRSTKLPASRIPAYQGDPARLLADLTLVPTESSPQEHSGACRSG